MAEIEAIAKLVNQLSKLPGVGRKTAQRLAYHIIALPEDQVRELAVAIFNGKKQIHFCPICGNSIHALGNAVVSCCGITLPALEAEDADEDHLVTVENVEDEHFITVHHLMTKAHYISFVAYVTSDRIQMVNLYPEGNAQTRLQLRGLGYLYYYCNQHGLFRKKV